MEAPEYKNLLHHAKLSYDYLHTNSTTHDFIFGAIIELVDNSRDANANNLFISVEKNDRTEHGQRILSFLDDGCGMDKDETKNVMKFGFSAKKFDPAKIGQYGNGLKSGAMRIAQDFILFTKRANVMTCLFLSRTFHEKKGILDNVLIAAPSFTVDTKEAICETENAKKRHEIEMDLILNYSPFRTMEDVFRQFARISSSGTLIHLFNLKTKGQFQRTDLDFSAEDDIRVIDDGDTTEKSYRELWSLRSYLAIIYLQPRMKIFIRGKQVRTRQLLSELYKPIKYDVTLQNFKKRSEDEFKRAEKDCQTANERAESYRRHMNEFDAHHDIVTVRRDSALAAERQSFEDSYRRYKEEEEKAKKRMDDKRKSRNKPKPLEFFFGINIQRRSDSGCMVYNNGRLIKMYQKVGSQKDNNIRCQGVMGVVDIPYVILEPTHNKQDFEDKGEYTSLLKTLGKYMDAYWKQLNLAGRTGGVQKFWEDFGYPGISTELPSNSPDFLNRRLKNIKLKIQCDECYQWRTLAFNKRYINGLPEKWTCGQSQCDPDVKGCSTPNKEERFPLGHFMESSEPTRRQQNQSVSGAYDNKPSKFENSENDFSSEESPQMRSNKTSTTAVKINQSSLKSSAKVAGNKMSDKAPAGGLRKKPVMTQTLRSTRSKFEKAKVRQYEESSDEEPYEDDECPSGLSPVNKPRTKAELLKDKKPSPSKKKSDNNGPQEIQKHSTSSNRISQSKSQEKMKETTPPRRSERDSLRSKNSSESVSNKNSAKKSVPLSKSHPNTSENGPITSKRSLQNDSEPNSSKKIRSESNKESPSIVTNLSVSTSRPSGIESIEKLSTMLKQVICSVFPPSGFNNIEKDQVMHLTTDELLGINVREFTKKVMEHMNEMINNKAQSQSQELSEKLAAIRANARLILSQLGRQVTTDAEVDVELAETASSLMH